MSHKKNSIIILGMLLLLATACKKEYTTIGNKLIEQPHFEGKIYEDAIVKTYDQKVDNVFATDLPLNALGIYKDPVFGTLESDMVTAVNMLLNTDSNLSEATTGDFGDNVKLVEAKLIIPYFSHQETDAVGTKHYVLDSVFGSHVFTIKVHENSFLLPSYDPSVNLAYTRSYQSDFDLTPFKTTLIGEDDHFIPTAEPYIVYDRETDGTIKIDDNGDRVVKDSLSPRMHIKLDTTFFRQKIFDHSGEDLITNKDRFADYFRGIYIDAIADNNDGRMMLLDRSKGKILVSYTHEIVNDHGTANDTSDDTIDTIYSEITLNLGSPGICTYVNSPSTNMQTAVNNSDMVNGDGKLYLKGDAGAETVVTLFDNQQLRELRSKDWMINQAELVFYVDDNAVQNALSKPQRLLLYDYENKKYLIDLHAAENQTTNNAYFDGTLKKDDNDNYYYSFKITRHIRNILKNNKMNVKLGLRVVSDISLDTPLLRGDIFMDPDRYNPTGTILYGNQTTVTDKKPLLRIYYTDPK